MNRSRLIGIVTALALLLIVLACGGSAARASACPGCGGRTGVGRRIFRPAGAGGGERQGAARAGARIGNRPAGGPARSDGQCVARG